MAEYEVELRATTFTTVYVKADTAEDAQEKALAMAQRHEIEGSPDVDDWEVNEVNER